MADVITRLKLESKEYDSKIKRATQGLLQMEQECRKVNGTLAVLEKDQMAYVQSLGKMQTVSTTVRGKISELTSAYTELATQYKRLTDEEKKGDYGKALSQSLQQLRGRIQDAKKDLGDVSKEINGSGGLTGALDGLAGKFGLSISQLAGWGAAISAAKTAVDVAKDAFFQSEGNIDEWGRTVEGAKGAYDVFLDTLNNGNWSNFFQNLSTAIQGARDLYDALDRLGSIKSNNQAAIAIVQQQIQKLRLMKQQGQDVDDQIKSATARLATLQQQAVTAGKTAGNKTVFNTIRNSVNSQQGAKVSDKSIQAAVGGIMVKGQAEFDKYKQTVSKFENWSKAQRTVTKSDMDGNSWKVKQFDINLLSKEQQRQYKLAKAITDRETEIQKGITIYAQAVQEGTQSAKEEFKGNRYALQGSGGGGSSTNTPKVTTPKEEIKEEMRAAEKAARELEKAQERLQEAEGRLTEAAASGRLKEYNDASRAVDTASKAVVRAGGEASTMQRGGMFMPGEGGFNFSQENLDTYLSTLKEAISQSDLGSTLQQNLMEKLKDGQQVSEALKLAMAGGVEGADLVEVSSLLKQKLLEGGGDISDETWQTIVDQINEKLEGSDFKITFNVDTKSLTAVAREQSNNAKEMAKNWQAAGSAISAVGQAMSQIEDPTAKVMGTIAQAVASVALGAAQAIAAPKPWPAWIAFAAAATASMITTIASIKSATAGSYAEGGIIPGNNYNDGLVANVSSGELILNRAQQASIASQLQNNNQGGESQPYVTGEMIYLGLNNYLKAAGYGELVTTRR